MLERYHGTTSVCAQKARLTLAERVWSGKATCWFWKDVAIVF
jgi:hypothetical protein